MSLLVLRKQVKGPSQELQELILQQLVVAPLQGRLVPFQEMELVVNLLIACFVKKIWRNFKFFDFDQKYVSF